MRSELLSLLISIPATLASAAEATSWEKLPSLPVGIGNGACGTVGNDLIIAGGITWQNDTKIWLDKTWRFDTKNKVWSEAGKLPYPLAYPAYGQTARDIYFAGGGDGKKTCPRAAFSIISSSSKNSAAFRNHWFIPLRPWRTANFTSWPERRTRQI